MDYPIDARFRAIEDRLTAIERDLAVIKSVLEQMDKRIPSPWFILALVLPLYGLFILGFAGMFYFLLTFVLPALPKPQ